VQIADTIKLYDSIQNNYKGDLHHYFRFVYHVLKYISKEDLLSEEEKYYYSTIYRAMFSPYELVLIFYNCLHPFGKDDFRPLIIEFSFFNNLDKSLLIDKSHYDNDYPKQAYERK
jgi:hypothetical protein